jgi:flagellar basal-body rod modification protein FlgD
MSSVAATSTSPASSYTDDTSTRTVKKTLGQEDFLRLLTTQMSNQDPMNPISDTNQIAQLAQFSSLQSMNSLLVNSQLAGASNMIGKNVTATGSDGYTHSGTVESVQMNSGAVYVNVDGESYAYSAITQVKAATIPAATP